MAFNRMCKVWMVFKMARELIRKATLEDMSVLLEIYERAREFMVSTGNTNQWTNGYPSREILTEDIERNETVSYTHLDVYKRQVQDKC